MTLRKTFCTFALFACAACAQPDVVATRFDVNDAGTDSGTSATCAPQLCKSANDLQSDCTSTAPVVQVGDSCSADNTQTLAFHFGACSCSELIAMGPVRIDGEGSLGINTNINSESPIELEGDLVIATDIAENTAADLSARSVMDKAEAPCRCEDQDLLDIPALVAAAAVSHDNALLDTTSLSGYVGGKELTLGCGRHYFNGVSGDGPLLMTVRGRAAVFIDGDVALDNSWTIALDAGASVDVFVSGNVRVVGALNLGGAADAGRVRLYVGGRGTVDLNADATVAGNLYAPWAELVTRGDFTVHGSLFARRIATSGALTVHYDAGAAGASSCE